MPRGYIGRYYHEDGVWVDKWREGFLTRIERDCYSPPVSSQSFWILESTIQRP